MGESKSSSDPSPKRGAEKGKQVSADPAERVVRTREQTTTRILDAAEELFASRNPTHVTVRQVAEKAGVTHALVHQYIGTKDDLLKAVVTRGAPKRLEMIAQLPDLRAVTPQLVNDVLERQLHSRAMIRSAMDGVDYASLEDRMRTGQALLALATHAASTGAARNPAPEPMDPRVVTAAITALAYGWVATGEWLTRIFDLEGETPEETRAQLLEMVSRMTEQIFPLEQDKGEPAA